MFVFSVVWIRRSTNSTLVVTRPDLKHVVYYSEEQNRCLTDASGVNFQTAASTSFLLGRMTGRAQRNNSSSSSFSSSTPKFSAAVLHEQTATSSLPHTPMFIMQRLLTFLGILTAEFVSGENRVDLLETIKAVEGDDVRLQCRLDPSLDLSAYPSDWMRVDLDRFVHVYRRKKDLLHLQMDQYRNRTTLNREDLSRGVLTLQISSVKLLDSGQYRCYVPELNAGCVVNFTVEKEQQKETKRVDSTTTGPPEEEVTEPDDPGDGNRNVVRAVIISTVVFVVFVVVFVLFVLVLKKKTIQVDEDPERPAGNIV